MSVDIGTVKGTITLEDQWTSAMKMVEAEMGQIAKRMDSIGASMSKAGRALSIGITAPLVAAAGASTLLSSKFEASMTRLVSLAGTSAGELAKVKQHILDLAPAVGIGPQALADAMTKVSSTVDDTNVALSILDIAAKGSAAGMGEAVDVAGALTAVVNSYGAANITAARAGDILTQTVKDGGAEAKELAPILANVVPIAAQLGVSFEEVGANIATVTKLGVPAAEAVTQLSSVFSALLKETAQGKEALSSINMTYAELRKEVREKGLMEALVHLSTAFKGNETALTDVFGRIEALRNVMSSAGQQADTYAKVLDNMKNSAGKLDDAFEAMKGTQVQTWGQLSAAVQVIAIRFGDALVPALKQVLEAAKPVLDWVLNAVKWFAALPDGVKTTTIAIAGAAAALGPLLIVLGSVAQGVSAIIGLVPLMGAALALATGPIGLVALALTGLISAVVIFRNHMNDLENQGKSSGKHWTEEGKKMDEVSQKARDLDKANQELGNVGMVAVIDKFKQGSKTAEDLKIAHESLAHQLAETQKVIGSLTTAQRADILAGDKMGLTNEEIVKSMKVLYPTLQLTEGAVKLFTEAQKASGHEADNYAKKLAAVNKEIAEAMRDVGNLSASQQDEALALREFGIEADKIGIKIKASGNAVEAFFKEFDATTPRLQEFRKIGEEGVNAVAKGLEGMPLVLRRVGQSMGDLTLDSKDLAATGTFIANEYGEAGDEIVKAMTKGAKALLPLNTQQKELVERLKAVGFTANEITAIFTRLGISASASMTDVQKRAQKASDTLAAWDTVLSNLSQAFTQLATIGGDSFGKVAQQIGTVIVAMEQIVKAQKEIDDAIAAGNKVSMASNIALAASYIGIMVAIYNIIDGILKAREAAKVQADQAAATMNVYREWLGVSKELADEITRMSTTPSGYIGGGGTRLAEALKINEIIADLGGISHLTADEMARLGDRLQLLFQIAKTPGAVDSRKAIEALDTALANMGEEAVATGGLVSDLFLDMVAQANKTLGPIERVGLELKKVEAFITSQLTSAEQGLAKALKISNDAYKTRGDLQKDLDKLKPERDDLMARQSRGGLGVSDSKRLDELNKQWDELSKKAKDAQTLFDITKIKTQETAEAVAATFIASIDDAMKHGKTFIQAIRDIGPDLQAMKEQLDQTGFSGGEAFDLILRELALVNDKVAGPALEAAEGYAAALRGMHNAGKLNQQMFSGLAGQIGQTAAALEAQGFAHDDVMAAMQGDLQTIWELQKRYGYAVDDTTQKMIDEAVASGAVGEAHMSSTDQMLAATKRMSDAIVYLAGVFGYVAPAAEAAASGVNTALDGIKVPTVPNPTKDLPRDVQGDVERINEYLAVIHPPKWDPNVQYFRDPSEDLDVFTRELETQTAAAAEAGSTSVSDDFTTVFGDLPGDAKESASRISDELAKIKVPRIEIPVIWTYTAPTGTGGLHAATGATATRVQQAIPRAQGMDTVLARVATGESILTRGETMAYEFTKSHSDSTSIEDQRPVVIEGDTLHISAVDAKSFLELAEQYDLVVLGDVEQKRKGKHKRLKRALGVKRSA